MIRRLFVGAICCLPLIAFAEDKPSEFEPDPDYKPKEGDRVWLFGLDKRKAEIDPWVSPSKSDCLAVIKSLRIADRDGLKEHREKGEMVILDSRTPIIVLSVEMGDVDLIEVRPTEGKGKGKRFWVVRYYVNRVVKKRKP